MTAFPAITHVALTVRDLGRSRPWYQRLFGSDPVIDEDTGPFRHVVWTLPGGSLSPASWERRRMITIAVG